MPTGTPATIIISAGQSNTVGYGTKTNFQAIYSAAQSDVDGNGNQVLIWNPTATAFQVAEMGVNDLSRNQGGTGNSGSAQVVLGNLLANEINDDVYIVKRSQDGSGIYNNWVTERPPTGFNLYPEFLERCFEAFAQVARPIGRIISFHIRGEQDSDFSGNASVHATTLGNWYSDLQADLGADFPIYFLECGLTDLTGTQYQDWNTINTQIQSIAGHEYTYAGGYTNNGANNQRYFYLAPDAATWSKLGDNIHYNAPGLEAIADQAFRLIRDYIL